MKSYREMRLIVLFDLPVGTKAERRKAQKFRDLLLKEGFIMMQFSCYSKFCRNDSEVSKYIRRIKTFNPNSGNVRLFSLTENQYEKMIILSGEKNNDEVQLNIDFPENSIPDVDEEEYKNGKVKLWQKA